MGEKVAEGRMRGALCTDGPLTLALSPIGMGERGPEERQLDFADKLQNCKIHRSLHAGHLEQLRGLRA
jgi:hypothetical protein